MTPCKKIAFLCTVMGYTQKFMGDKLNLTKSAFGKLARGEQPIGIDRLRQIANIFGIDVNWLISEEPFTILIQSDINGNLTLKIIEPATQSGGVAADITIAIELMAEQGKNIGKMYAAIETLLKLLGEKKKGNSKKARR